MSAPGQKEISKVDQGQPNIRTSARSKRKADNYGARSPKRTKPVEQKSSPQSVISLINAIESSGSSGHGGLSPESLVSSNSLNLGNIVDFGLTR